MQAKYLHRCFSSLYISNKCYIRFTLPRPNNFLDIFRISRSSFDLTKRKKNQNEIKMTHFWIHHSWLWLVFFFYFFIFLIYSFIPSYVIHAQTHEQGFIFSSLRDNIGIVSRKFSMACSKIFQIFFNIYSFYMYI